MSGDELWWVRFTVEVLLDEDCEVVDLVEDDDPTIVALVVHFHVVVRVEVADLVRLRVVVLVLVLRLVQVRDDELGRMHVVGWVDGVGVSVHVF